MQMSSSPQLAVLLDVMFGKTPTWTVPGFGGQIRNCKGDTCNVGMGVGAGVGIGGAAEVTAGVAEASIRGKMKM